MITGGCNCGKVTFEITSEISDIIVCHCSICRKSTGSNGIPVVLFEKANFRWIQGEDNIKTWKKPESEWQKWFCTTCASPLPGINDETRMYAPVGGLQAGAEDLKVMHHIWTSSKATWDQITDAGKQHSYGFEKD